MTKYKVSLLAFLFFFTFSLISCSDDDSMDEKEMEQSVDITAKVVGMYNGNSKFSEGGSFFTEDDIIATINKSTNSTAVIKLPSLSGTVTLNATLDSDSTFTVESESIYSEGPFMGTGSVIDDALLIELSTADNKEYEFIGVRQ